MTCNQNFHCVNLWRFPKFICENCFTNKVENLVRVLVHTWYGYWIFYLTIFWGFFCISDLSIFLKCGFTYLNFSLWCLLVDWDVSPKNESFYGELPPVVRAHLYRWTKKPTSENRTIFWLKFTWNKIFAEFFVMFHHLTLGKPFFRRI